MNVLRTIGVNCGNGVILYPFLKSKYFKVVAGIENRPIFKTPGDIQWELNFPEVPLFNKNAPLPKIYNIDALITAPDCGHSSILALSRSKKFGKASENKSLALSMEAIELYQPKFFLFENLPALLKQSDIGDFSKIWSNYKLLTYLGPVSAFGNSQTTRKRLIIIGIRKDLRVSSSKFKLPSKESLNLAKVKELEADLDSLDSYQNECLCNIREDNNTIITMFRGYKISLKEAQHRWLTELKKKRRWPTGETKMVNAPGVYRNLPNSYPLTVRKGNREFNTHGLMMTPRERARIMGIPDDFKIWYSPEKRLACINKGRVTVTKTIPYEVVTWFKKSIIKSLK